MFADYLILRFCTTCNIRELNRAQTFLVLQYLKNESLMDMALLLNTYRMRKLCARDMHACTMTMSLWYYKTLKWWLSNHEYYTEATDEDADVKCVNIVSDTM